jgi:hypothetical protein
MESLNKNREEKISHEVIMPQLNDELTFRKAKMNELEIVGKYMKTGTTLKLFRVASIKKEEIESAIVIETVEWCGKKILSGDNVGSMSYKCSVLERISFNANNSLHKYIITDNDGVMVID